MLVATCVYAYFLALTGNYDNIYLWLSHLSPGSFRLSAAGINVRLLSSRLCQLFNQLQTNASVASSHKNVAFQFH